MLFLAIQYNLKTDPLNIICSNDKSVIYINKRASLACAARLADTLCLPEAPGVTLINYKGDKISKYVCPTCYNRYRTKNHKRVMVEKLKFLKR